MAGGAQRGHVEAEDPLLRAADPVAAATPVLENLSAALVEQHVAAHLLGMGVGQPVGAQVAAGLLVGDEDELQGAALRTPSSSGQGRSGDRFGGDLGLHVQGAAAPQEAVGEIP